MKVAKRLPEPPPALKYDAATIGQTHRPASVERNPSRRRRIETAPALIMVLAPVIGLAAWIALFKAIF